MEVGHLERRDDQEKGAYYVGAMTGLPQYAGQVFVVPRLPKRTDASPDWTVKGLASGRWVEIGLAWSKTVRSGEHQGKAFLSLLLDFPGLAAPISLAAFPGGTATDGETGEVMPALQIVWGRYDAKRRKSPPADPLPGDGVPF